MKQLGFLVILSVLIVNCSKDEKTPVTDCNTENPIEELGWLRELKDTLTNCTCQISIIQGTYRNQPVFYLALTDPLCNGISIPTLFNCEGKPIKKYTADDFQNFSREVTLDSVLYSCKE